MAWLSFALGALASLLAAIGLYSVLAFQVATRTREIGLRMAVGASRGRVARLLLGNMLRLALSGMAAGGLLAFFAARLLHAQIADLVSAPPLLYAAACALLLVSALVAALLPTLRAANTNPTEALRSE
jgi:putative ABC transport system permease protein